MKTEIEAKFTKIAIGDLREQLKSLGAHCNQPMRLMKRVVIETDDLREKDAFVRVRDQGDKITITYKQFGELSLTGAKEIEITVNSFDDAVALLDAAGLPHRSYQESKRESWTYKNTQIEIDEWPWLEPYIEIEGETSESVKSVAGELGFEWNDAVFGDVMAA